MMKSSISADQDHHMDMLTMMMQMEKQLPEFCNDPFQGSVNPSSPDQIHFSNTPPIDFPNPDISSPLINTFTTLPISNSNSFKCPNTNNSFLEKKNSMAAMREMIFRIAAMQPIHIDPESVKPPKRRNVKISKDPQSVAARHRRERISEKIRILQRLVPGGTKMDTASMLDEAIHYVKFLKRQVQSLEQASANYRPMGSTVGFPSATAAGMSNVGYSSLVKGCQPSYDHLHHHGNMQMLR